MRIYQESRHDDKGNEHPTPKIGCQHDNLLKEMGLALLEEIGREICQCTKEA
jgi:hypothetical protein